MKKALFTKNNRTILVIALCLFYYSFLPAQTDSVYTLLKEIPVKATLLSTDKVQQCYIRTTDNDVVKYNAEGKEIFRFNNNNLGSLGMIDATNPFNILLYYPEYLTIVTLDRTLNQTSEFNLYNLDVVEVKAIGMSNDNNIWIYDDLAFKVKKINRRGVVLEEGDNLSLELGISIQPNFMLEKDNRLYVNDPSIGILVFDIYGNYIKTIDLKGLTDFQILNRQLIYVKEGLVHTFHLTSLFSNTLPLPPDVSTEDKIHIQQNRLYVLQKECIKIYRF